MKKIFLLAVLLTVLFGSSRSYAQAQPYIGQIASFAGNFAPVGWMKCEGQLLPISEYEALFVLIGTTYGGDGQSTFALPDYRGRTLIGVGAGPGLSSRVLGEAGGSPTTTLIQANLPQHVHSISASSLPGTTDNPVGNIAAHTGNLDKEYASPSAINTIQTGATGSNIPISNPQPYLGITYMIAVEGVFPVHP